MPLTANCSVLDARVHTEYGALPPLCTGMCDPAVGRVAVIVAGQIRTLNLQAKSYPREWQKPTRCNYPSPKSAVDQSIAHTFQTRLYVTLTAFDVFAVLEATTREQFHSACRSLRPQRNGDAKLTCHLATNVSWSHAESSVYRNFSHGADSPVRLLRHKSKRAAANLASSLAKQQKAYSLLRNAEMKRQHTYTHVVFTRPDVLLVSPFPHIGAMDFGSTERGRLYFPGSNCIGGHEDWMAVGRASTMAHYLQRGGQLQMDAIAGFGTLGWGAEEWVHHVVRAAGGETTAHPGIDACLVREPYVEPTQASAGAHSTGPNPMRRWRLTDETLELDGLPGRGRGVGGSAAASGESAACASGAGQSPRLAVLVWQGADPGSRRSREITQSMMLLPVVRTLVAGARQAGSWVSVSSGGGVGSSLLDASSVLRAGDLFVWVGIFRLESGAPDGNCGVACSGVTILRSLAARGLHTVFYSSDAVLLNGRFCDLNNQLAVKEVWEYSHSTIDYCNRSKFGLGHTTRHLPPGYVGGAPIANRSSSSGRLVFLGAMTPQRRACVAQLEAGFRRLWTQAGSSASDGTGGTSAGSGVISGMSGGAGGVILSAERSFTSASVDQLMGSHAYFLNLHKECEAAAAQQTDCETLRFSQLLSKVSQ